MLTSERIKSLAPFGAQAYRLLAKLSDGTSRLFPSGEGTFFRMGDAPVQVPLGKYTICYYDSANQLLTYLEDALELTEHSELHPSRPVQLPLNFQNAGGTVATPAVAGTAPKSAAPLATPPRGADAKDSAPPTSEAELEFRRYLHAMDLEERQQEFIKNSTYVTEVGELFVLNRMMRRELLEMQRIILGHSQQAYQDVDRIKGTVHELLALQRAVLEHAATQIARPPAPPPDYVGLGHAAIGLIKEIGVALIQRTQAQVPSDALRGRAAAPQLPAPAADLVTPAPAGGSDVVEPMLAKLKGMNELDLALAMSSPEHWKSLLEGLRTTNQEPVPANEGSAAPASPGVEFP